MKKKLVAKLRSRAGESLTETLVALLIAALGLVILAGAISSTNSMVQRSKTVMTSYYTANNALEAQSGSKTDLSVSITSFGDYPVEAYSNDVISGKTVAAYYPKTPTTSSSSSGTS